jgi:hypothetical protein
MLQQMRHQRDVTNGRGAAWHYGCTASTAEDVVRTGTRISLVVIILMLIVSVSVVSRLSSAEPSDVRMVHRSQMLQEVPPPADVQAVPHERADEGAGIADLYGNEVSDAVAKYKADGAGALYELHSPQTEVPRLGSPKS